MAAEKYLFGPVPSRRLGLSLGVDAIPMKVCTMDCVYCELGASAKTTLERQAYVPAEGIFSELKKRIKKGLDADFITISGSGEPTLNSKLGQIIEGIKQITTIPVAVLTNGSLFFDPEVRADCAAANVILPSLDSGDEEVFRKINRPDKKLTLEGIVTGLCDFRAEYTGAIWLEIFLVEGVNIDPDQIKKIIDIAKMIRPDKIQLNTAVRPTAEPGIGPVDPVKLAEIARQFGENAEVIADFSRLFPAEFIQTNKEGILSILSRRPCSVDDICSAFGIHRNEAIKYITLLLDEKSIISEKKSGIIFYKVR